MSYSRKEDTKNSSIDSLSALGVKARKGNLAKKGKKLENITQHCGDKETRAKSDPEHDVAPSRPVTRSVTANPPRSMTIIAETASLRLQNCSKCKKGPLDLSKIHYETQRYPGYLHVLCQTCGHVNVINIQNSGESSESAGKPGRTTDIMSRRVALGCLHQGLGHSQYEGLMVAMQLKPVSQLTLQRAEKEVGLLIEETAKES